MTKGILLGDKFPDFRAETNEGFIPSFYDWIGKDSWAILFSHPRDFTPVCTTELARLIQLASEFKKRNVKLIGLSCDSAESHRKWANDIIALCKMKCNDDVTCCSGNKLPFPIIADEKRFLATELGMMDPDERDEKGNALTARCVFIIGPEETLKLSILYPATTGRNFDEILRVVDSLQLTAVKLVATPVDWKDGDDCVVLPIIDDNEAKKLFGENINTIELPSGKHYLRMVAHPK
uniref:1-Cys peroxiredoxin n=1 Tax=Dirofilaria repens TaxID=31241 RepID=A0A6G8QHH1_9BILA|nr:thioredoxin peroxidase [Dirofilaria repens]